MRAARHLILGVAAAALAAGGATGAPDAGDAAAPAAGASGGVQVAHQRPPSRLWYRIHARFRGERVREAAGPNGTTTIRYTSGYVLRANAATRVTVSCGSTRVAAQNRSCAEVRRRIRSLYRGARRQRLLRGLRETYSFRANMTGRMTNGSSRATVDPITVTSPTGQRVACTPSAQLTARLQATRQRARGFVASQGGSGEGVVVQATPVGTSGAALMVSEVTCPTFLDDPPTFTAGGDASFVDATWEALDRGLLSFIDGREQSEHLRFDRPPGRFGRTFSIRRTITESGGRMNPAGQIDRADRSRRHEYTLIFRVCARGGRVPRGC